MKKIVSLIMVVLTAVLLVSCSGMSRNYMQPGYIGETSDDEFNEIVENKFVKTIDHPTSNISLSANTASYSMLRKQIEQGDRISKDMVRIEEMVNYFKYDYKAPQDNDVLSIQNKMMTTPWNQETKLLLVGMQAQKIETKDIDNNIVFLLDVSGSMASSDKLPLIQQSIPLLLEHLNGNDRISIVTYASSDRVLLSGEPASNKLKIEAVISDLHAQGGTAGAKGIQTAYDIAQEHFIEGGNNRVILATDGDFNVGISSQKELESFISKKRETGIYLSVFGFGMGNLKDNKLETLAQKGNGHHAYIDTLLEARKALIEDIDGTLYTVARDAKAQISFNLETVESYRLIGYENRQLTDDEFNNDDTDAGELGAGHQVTAIYELRLTESSQTDLADFTLKYKEPDINKKDVLTQVAYLSKTDEGINDFDAAFISSVVEFGLILRDSIYKEDASMTQLIARIEDFETDDDYKNDFIRLVKHYQDSYVD